MTESTQRYRGRFAPSPTGDLHLGSVATAVVAWLYARRAGGPLILRVEDIDTPRVVAGSEARQLDDLRWLGFDWDEGPDVGGPHAPYRQSERVDRYEAALASLAARGLTYLCDCSRAEIARVASAPHEGDDGPRYPGICRAFGMTARAWKRPPAVRLAVPDRVVVIDDALQGRHVQNVAASVGDFVLQRGDGVYAYQLAVVVDDVAMRITEVVRGYDLLTSAPRQALLAELLGAAPPGFAHVPLVVDAGGVRLEKRSATTTVAGLRAAGATAADVVGRVAGGLGLVPRHRAASLNDVARAFDLSALRGRPIARLPEPPA